MPADVPDKDAEVNATVFEEPTVLVAYCATGLAMANFVALPASFAGTLESVSSPAFTNVDASVPSYVLLELTDNVPPTVIVRTVMFAANTGSVNV